MLLLHTLGSLGLALVLSVGLGLTLGRAATHWFSGRGFSNLLMDVRGALLSFVLCLLIIETYLLPSWLAVGAVVGTSQAIAVTRWLTRRSGEWTPALLGGIALGRSTSALVTRRAAARGAVTATVASTLLHVLVLEGLLHLILRPSAATSVGALFAASTRGIWSVLGLAVAIALLLLESWASAVLQKNRRPDEPSG